MFELEHARTVYSESRVSNAHVHLGRFLAAFVVFSLGWAVGMAAVDLLLYEFWEDLLSSVIMYAVLGSFGAWFPAAAWTSYLAGRGGEA